MDVALPSGLPCAHVHLARYIDRDAIFISNNETNDLKFDQNHMKIQSQL